MACELCEKIWDIDNLELDCYLKDKDYVLVFVRDLDGRFSVRVHDIKDKEVDYLISYFQYCPQCGSKLTEENLVYLNLEENNNDRTRILPLLL